MQESTFKLIYLLLSVKAVLEDAELKETDCSDLLRHLKSTVENLLICHSSMPWNVSGGSHRLQVAVIKVLKHGFRFMKDNGDPDFWVFIQGLCWLQPTLAASPSFIGHPSSPIRSPFRNSNKALNWIHRSLENNTLSEKLSWLLSDHEHLLSCYYPSAFLRQPQYNEAALICLKAVEKRQISILAKIDSALYLMQKPTSTGRRRRLSPNNEPTAVNCVFSPSTTQELNKMNLLPDAVDVKTISCPGRFSSYKSNRSNNEITNSIFKCSARENSVKRKIKHYQLKKWFSCSDIYPLHQKLKNRQFFFKNCEFHRPRARSVSGSVHGLIDDYVSGENNFKFFSEILQVRYTKPDSDTKTNRTPKQIINQKSVSLDSLSSVDSDETIICRGKITRSKRKRRVSFLRLPFSIWESSDEEHSNCSDDAKTLVHSNMHSETDNKKSFIENGGNIMLPVSIGSYPKPSPGQSIMSYLSSGVFTQTNAELDRENAHFNIAEVVIAILEQVKSDQQFGLIDDIFEESDEEINNLKRIIRIRRQQKRNEKLHSQIPELSTDTSITTDQSANSLSSSVYSTSESLSTDQEEKENHNMANHIPSLRTAGLSVSKLSLNADTANYCCLNNSSLSAESVAISILKKFNGNQLPAASEIEWLVSESEAPQQILPLPNNIRVNMDGNGDGENTSLLRGTSEWAPPRPQIIFTPHPPPVRRLLMEKQTYRCAGCGTKVAQKYASKFRYCEYLGRYFCTGCHSEQTAIIPGRILTKWDFSKYPVSNFSFQLLDQLSTDPLFNVMDLNPALYKIARGLQKVRLIRIALFYLKNFIFSCKYSKRLAISIQTEEKSHIYNDPDCYSLMDFVSVKSNKMFKTLSELKKLCENHVNRCQLCQARGFICLKCKKQDIIFPWQLSTVLCCSECNSCYHIKCYNREPKCSICFRGNNKADI